MNTSTNVGSGTRDVLDAAEAKAGELGATLSDGARTVIEQRVSGPMNALEKENQLKQHGQQIYENTSAFIEYVFRTQLDSKPGIITIDHISNSLSSYCQKHKNQLPFCR
jgi:hypothetical protein